MLAGDGTMSRMHGDGSFVDILLRLKRCHTVAGLAVTES